MRKLTEIAKLMRLQAKATGRAQKTLPRGLTITLLYDAETEEWGMSLTRKGVLPSRIEREICKNACHVPGDSPYDLDYAKGYHIIRYSWRETPPQAGQMSFLEEEDIKPVSKYYDQ